MKRIAKLFIVYFPIILVTGQVLANGLYFVWREGYYAAGFYLNTFLGTNVFFSIFLVSFTFMFNFCRISRAAAIAECLFAINYMIIQKDNTYNIMFQVIVGLTAIAYTIRVYSDKFPLCRLSLFVSFVQSMVHTKSCKQGLEHWDEKIKNIIVKHHHENHR